MSLLLAMACAPVAFEDEQRFAGTHDSGGPEIQDTNPAQGSCPWAGMWSVTVDCGGFAIELDAPTATLRDADEGCVLDLDADRDGCRITETIDLDPVAYDWFASSQASSGEPAGCLPAVGPGDLGMIDVSGTQTAPVFVFTGSRAPAVASTCTNEVNLHLSSSPER